jgi:hypothetical protein
MTSFTSIKPVLDAMSTEELISAGEYISQKLEKQLDAAVDAIPSTEGASTPQVRSSIQTSETQDTVPPKPFRLLDLPRELRDEILFYALQTNLPTSAIHDGNKAYPQAKIPALMHTSCQLRFEAAEPFFTNHKFVFWGDGRFSRLSSLLSISGNIWNKYVKIMVLVPDEWNERADPWDIYDPESAASTSRKWRVEARLGEGVVWTAMRRAGLGREVRYQVMGEVAVPEGEPNTEIVVG